MESEFIDLRVHQMSEENKAPNLARDLVMYLEHKETITKLGYDPNEPCKIYFYEWSDLKQEKFFNDEKTFAQFLKDSDLELKYWEESQVKRLSHTNGVHIMCKPNSHDLLIEASFASLEGAYKRVTTPTTYRSYTPGPRYCGNPAYAGYQRYYDEDDWD